MLAPMMGAQNPMQVMMQNFGNDPNFARAMQMAQGKTPEQLEQTVKNMCQQNGVDFDQFKQTFSRFAGFK